MYELVPPEADAVAVPLLPPPHDTDVVVMLIAIAAGCVIVTLTVDKQLLTSVTVAVYVPAASPVLMAVVRPFDHK